MSVYYDPKESPEERLLRGLIFIVIILLLALFMALTSSDAKSQAKPSSIEELRVGEMLPGLNISTLNGTSQSHKNLADFSGKPLVLIFWSTTCKGSRAAMETAWNLKRKSGEKLQVLLVTAEPKGTLEQFFDAHPKERGFKLPVVAEDKELFRLFPHVMVPHIAWLSAERSFLGTTTSADLTAQNIETLLQGNIPAFKFIKKDRLDFNYEKPLLPQLVSSSPKNYSYLSEAIPGLGSQAGTRRTDSTVRFYAINTSLSYLCKRALSLPTIHWADNRLVIENDSLKQYFVKPYCYESLLPFTQQKQLNEIIKQDLARYFNLELTVENKEVSCLVLSRSTKKCPDPQTGTYEDNFYSGEGQYRYFKNGEISVLTDYLNSLPGMLPILNETGIDYRLSLTLGAHPENTDSLKEVLNKQGLRLEKTTKHLDMLVVRQLKNY